MKNPTCRGVFTKNEGDNAQKGALGQFVNLRAGGGAASQERVSW